VDCVGIATRFVCQHCAEEGELWLARTCLRCSLRRRVQEALADEAGRVPDALGGLRDALAGMPDPWAGLIWLQPRAVRARLHALAIGAVPLSHEGLDLLPPGQGREYLRDLLMVHRLIPAQDKHLLAFQRWARTRLDSVEGEEDRRLVRLYLRWRHHRELAARADAGPLPSSVVACARVRTNAGLRLLSWLRTRGVELAQCGQDDLDVWYATVSNPGQAADFLAWAIRHRHCPTLVLPRQSPPHRAPGTEQERLQLLAWLLSDDTLELVDRVAGSLVLLLAQPVSRVAALTLDDIESREGTVWLRLGDQPVQLPEPLGSLLVALSGQRRHLRTAAHPASRWLFPGHAPGQALTPQQLRSRLSRLGVTIGGRQAALRSLLGEVPVPVLAEVLGYHAQTLTGRATDLAADWAGYAATKVRDTASG
jgi:integrase